MARWDPGTEQRLIQAALDLYSQHGYDNVTITQIAERAGITRRSYFRYFPDKREVLFARSEQLPLAMADAVTTLDESLDPLTTALRAISEVGTALTARIVGVIERRAVISASVELQERNRTKLAAVADAVGDALRRRGADPDQSVLIGQLATIVFETAYNRWADEGGRVPFVSCVDAAAETLRAAVSAGLPQ
jgi:AcrR family transcriptional regulator